MANDTRIEPRRGGLRILVLDDNRDAADSLSQLLALWGHEPVTAYGSLTALELGRIYRPDVALLDLGVPHLSGLDVARALRQQMECKDVILIAVTGHGEPDTIRRARMYGFAHHLLKPVDLDYLQELLAGLQAHICNCPRPARGIKATQKLPVLKAKSDARKPPRPV